jgi:hypothetical protein
LRAFDGDLHCNTRLIRRWKSRAAKGLAAAFGNPKSLIEAGFDQTLWGDPKVARMARERKRCVMPFPTFCGETRVEQPFKRL